MADLQKIAEDLSSLSVIEAAELSKILEEKWGVSAAAAAPVAISSATGGDAAPASEILPNDLLILLLLSKVLV